MDRDMSGFTLPMAALDAVPVMLFACGSAAFSRLLESGVFTLGGCVCAAAGACKVSWKAMLGAKQRDVEILNGVFHALMPAGFCLMLAGAALKPKHTAAALLKLLGRPQRLYFGIGAAGMALLGVLNKKLDFSKPAANWAGEIVNTASQGAVAAGLLLMK